MELEKPEQLLLIAYRYGLLPRRHAKAWFWPDQTDRAMEKALKKLKDGEFINWPSDEERSHYNIPEPFFWLDWRGILFVAAQHGLTIEEPDRVTETWKRDLKKQLAAAGLYWMRNPSWSTLRHEILCIDITSRILHDIDALPYLQLEQHLADHAFRVRPDTVRYRFPIHANDIREKEVIPDMFFTLFNQQRQARGQPARLRLPFEVDNATHPEASAIANKLAAGTAWLKSDAFKARFGGNTGVWLVVTTGGQRLQNMMAVTREHQIAWAHLFCTTEDLEAADNLFTAPIWRKADDPDTLVPFPL
jgi:hypothetical protein